jgi:ATP-dependent Lon protease
VARCKVTEEEYNKKLNVEDLVKILGPAHSKDKYQGNEVAGVVTGLAWTPVGGDILFIESSLSQGKGRLTLTGNLGEVMKESAMIALQYIKSKHKDFGLNPEIFSKWDVHIHVPEGATPKDGPSAGITMLTSLMSIFTQRKVKKNLAMSGEITLRGRVLPVGGIKEKILAAKRADIKEIVLSKDNKKDIDEIKPEYLKGLTFHYVTDMSEVVEYALLMQKVKNPEMIN